ncbi:hypothetical protein B0J11DRAFT_611750 [Dendryphion nanum]|uniref:Uncharacterized protein n=1 Tax=Dendryphion nanum TaxID=256645 RepID=A0A9P9EEA2_9PLEO|nr:hypothetical protein B0J11DRAFT_611750 [Dendryphion nanum]
MPLDTVHMAAIQDSKPGSTHSDGDLPNDSIHVLALRFLDNVKAHFGEQSKTSTIIHGILGEFKRGKETKRNAYLVIRDQLEGVHQLQTDLDALLCHKDACYDVRDFLPEESSYTVPSPKDDTNVQPPQAVQLPFLEPQHHPQLPVAPQPSLFSDDRYIQYSIPLSFPQPTINPDFLYSRYVQDPPSFQQPDLRDFKGHSYEYVQSNLGAQNFEYFHQPAISPHGNQSANFHQQFPVYDVNGYSLPARPYSQPAVESQLHHLPTGEAWDQIHFEQQEIRGPTEVFQYYDHHTLPSSTNHPSTPPLEAHESSTLGASSSVLHTPDPVSFDQSLAETVSPNKYDSNAYTGAQLLDPGKEPVVHQGSPHLPVTPLPSQEDVSNLIRKRPSKEAKFVHSICGKKFTTRHAVKKHHWGIILNNIHTTTGCWSKNGKPNIDWDHHPSCKEQVQPKFRTRGNRQELQPNLVAKIAPATPATPTRISNSYELPTLHDLPNKVMESLYAPSSAQFPLQDEILLYYNSRLPNVTQNVGLNRSGFDALLTAVNVASEIDAPAPQARNDSIISNLDRVASHGLQQYNTDTIFHDITDQNSPKCVHTTWQSTSQGGQSVPAVGLGISNDNYGDRMAPLPFGFHVPGNNYVESDDLTRDLQPNSPTKVAMTTAYDLQPINSDQSPHQPQ